MLNFIECFIQRDSGYTMRNEIVVYTNTKAPMLREDIKTVVAVAHSPRGIIMSLAQDNVLANLPRECIIRLCCFILNIIDFQKFHKSTMEVEYIHPLPSHETIVKPHPLQRNKLAITQSRLLLSGNQTSSTIAENPTNYQSAK